MKIFFTIILVLVLFSSIFAQKRFLVSPQNEAYPIKANESAHDVMQRIIAQYPHTSSNSCSNYVNGYEPSQYVPNQVVSGKFKDVLAMWFIAPATGTIDTLYWVAGSEIDALDSGVTVRIHKSNIGPGVGPGYTSSGGCQNWGYWLSSYDLDEGIAAFPEDATDTTWISTRYPHASFPPVGSDLWGIGGGLLVYEHAEQINTLDLSVFNLPQVNKNDWLWISMTVNSLPNPDTAIANKTEFFAFDNTNGAPTPSRFWKFYERPSGKVSCGSFFTSQKGWISEGGPGDSTTSYGLNWWYSMTVTSDLPPTIHLTSTLQSTTLTSSREVDAEIDDCNAANPESAGVALSRVLYSYNNGTSWDSVSMTNTGGDTWQGFIPGVAGNTTVWYKVGAYDVTGNRSETPTLQYRVVALQNQYYTLDTTSTYNWIAIDTSGTQISNWFDRTPFAVNGPQDNGTAGPFLLQFPFPFFGDTFKYAWVGVNGGMTLSATSTDTIDVYPRSFSCSGGYTTIPSDCNPENYLAPLSFNFVVIPKVGSGNGHGSIYYQNDTDKFIVEWYHLGHFIDTTDTVVTFEAILNKDGSILFQYGNLGADGIDTKGFVGLQENSASKWFALNILGAPPELKPANNKAYKFIPAGPLGVHLTPPAVPMTTELEQNYPNPFNPTTNFGFRIAERGLVTLKVYDLLGREVTTLVNEVKPPGEYNAQWDATSVPSGVYYYRMQIGNTVQTKKMVVMK